MVHLSPRRRDHFRVTVPFLSGFASNLWISGPVGVIGIVTLYLVARQFAVTIAVRSWWLSGLGPTAERPKQGSSHSETRQARPICYDWTLSETDTGSGTLTAGAPDGSGFDITALTGTIDGNPIDGLLGFPSIRGATISPLGAFIYDNIVYPGSARVFDTWGVLFSISGAEGNIWGNGGPHDYSYYECCYAVANDQVDTFTLTQAAVGEPSSFALFGGGLLGLWVVRRHKAA